MKERQRNTIKFVVNKIIETDISNIVQSIWLFGSCARDEDIYSSDVDIVCIINSCNPEDRRIMRRIRSEASCTNVGDPDVDIIFKYNNGNITCIPWNEDNSTFSKQLRKDAIKIWERS